MRIDVKTPNDRDICIRIPTALVLNHLTALIGVKAAQHYGASLTINQAFGLIDAIRDFKHLNGSWTFVEVESASGEHIKITV